MNESAALLEALGLMVPFATHAPMVLRKALAELVTGRDGHDEQGVHPTETAAPSQLGGTGKDGAVAMAQSDGLPRAVTPQPARAQRAGLPVGKSTPARRNSRKSDLPTPLDPTAWLALRQAVRQHQPGNATLAAAIGLSVSTVAAAMGKRAPPSAALVTKLQVHLAELIEGGKSDHPVAASRKAVDGAEALAAAEPPGNGASPALPQRAAEAGGNSAAPTFPG